ncbi:alginate lyase family protein [Magnetospirillum sp. UT-4]|uniref:alginate lyase family protein n=1 Tax=Magnetospirillum sp. UT-4 TaxID=2681467 RepID=UPI00137CDB01|nr:alginate lyase family protein [Magnetospirillum sp. UT-4]CAA7612157.1 conserved hypothetical protein [Magnetospirillum sp. UT-4]
MALGHLIRHALAMSPGEAARKALRYALRQTGRNLVGRLMRGQCSFPPVSQVQGRLARRLARPDQTLLAANADAIRAAAAAARAHRFDLLGSGPVRVAHGERYPGFGPWRYGPGAALPPEWRQALAGQAWRGNRARVLGIVSLIEDESYRPIDWHVDFRSGYRWSPRRWGGSVPYGHAPGVDIKLPWELARLQHLPVLAMAFGLDGDARLAAEFRNQVLDFIAANPPGWGVNWACAMDVAIRAANIVLARDLFLAFGADLDEPFEEELTVSMLAHARHIAGNLEWNQAHRGNHYLADICGLAWIAAYLPADAESDTFLVFAVQQLAAEIERQFLPDGANFEASTAYHRLSAEMALYTVAMVLGLPEERRRAFRDYDHTLWRRRPALAPGPMAWPPFSDTAMERLARAVRFAAAVTMPSGIAVQVGDNDSGRFFKLTPGTADLDFGPLIAAGKGVFDLDLATAPQAAVESAVIADLAGGTRFAVPCDPAAALPGDEPETDATTITRVVVTPPDPAALEGMEAVAYPEFGLFIWRGARAFVSVRCGPIGQNGNGGHAHNDQLAVEIEIDGVPWARDPGTFVYTPDPAARNAYRSALAHCVPRHGEAEPAGLLAPFRLEDRAQARALRFQDGQFLGRHDGFGERVWRRVLVGGGAVVIEDCRGGTQVGDDTAVTEHLIADPGDLAANVAYSPGYGRVEASG